MISEDLKKMIEWEVLHRYSNLKNAEDSVEVIIKSIEREVLKQKMLSGIDAIKMIASEEAWEESEAYYLDRWKSNF